ncbi:MAG: sigma 54-interacting transcriptional regulator [Acidobacteriota bacterium]
MPVEESQFFREMTLRICGSLDIDQALSEAFGYLEKHVPVDAMGLGYNNLDQETVDRPRIFVVAKVARPGSRFIWKDESDEIALSDEVVAYTRSPPDDFPTALVINRPEEQHPAMRDVFPGVATNSAVFVRLELQDELTGVLLISAEGPCRYSPEHTKLLESIREPFAIAMTNARRHLELGSLKDLLAEDHRALADDFKRSFGSEVVGADFGLRRVMEQVRQIAPSNSPTLLLGETGTGKEVIAHAIHMASPRGSGPMITMQCGAIPDSLLDSELFGHERGAFTGAVHRKRGRFERAHGGTLFLDEVGELSMEAQVKLLRVLQERQFERVGGTETIEADVRVLAATHRDLEQMVRDGTFREDLWYRLNVLPIHIPPLRLRPEDIPSLVQYFIAKKAQELNRSDVPRVTSMDLERLKAYAWPGNVRELQNVIERALILSTGRHLVFPALEPVELSSADPIHGPREERVKTMDEAIAAHIRDVLERTRWKVSGPGGAAELLSMNPSTLRFRMGKLGISRRTG